MNARTHIISLIENHHLINQEDNTFLKDIISKFPFFSTANILLSKGLLNVDSIKYNKQLKISAAYCKNRRILFNLIKRKEEIKEDSLDLTIGSPLKFKENESHSFSQWLSLTKIKKIDRSTEKEDNDLIDNFIQNKPSIKSNKNEFFSAPKAAKTSLIEDDELVTETLARVYLEQEHFEKAIEAYKKLSLKYPKKSSLFAEQINLINDLKHQ